MQLLYHNLLDDGTVTATNANAAYPVTNLTYKYQRSRTLLAMFKSATNSSVITCNLTTPATIDAIGVGNHNIAQLQIILKNSLGATVCDGSRGDGFHKLARVLNLNLGLNGRRNGR